MHGTVAFEGRQGGMAPPNQVVGGISVEAFGFTDRDLNGDGFGLITVAAEGLATTTLIVATSPKTPLAAITTTVLTTIAVAVCATPLQERTALGAGTTTLRSARSITAALRAALTARKALTSTASSAALLPVRAPFAAGRERTGGTSTETRTAAGSAARTACGSPTGAITGTASTALVSATKAVAPARGAIPLATSVRAEAVAAAVTT